jgi:tetratricopeptide (TPR) repeat protein
MAARSFNEEMLGTYVNLSAPGPVAPIHAWRPWLSWQKCCRETEQPEGNLQRVLPPGFRESLAIELGGTGRYAVFAPNELDPALRTAAWDDLCELLGSYEALSPRKQAAVLETLLSLGFFNTIARIAAMPSADAIASSTEQASIGLIIAAAKIILANVGQGKYDLSLYEFVATHALLASPTRFTAAIELVVQHAKYTGDVEAAAHWRAVAQSALDLLVGARGQDSFASLLLISRFYRSGAYVPFMRGERKQVEREMQLCEDHALAMQPGSHVEQLVATENLVPVLQSRAKEARWLRDLPLALSRLERARDLDPLDSLRWVELGEIHLDLSNYADAFACYTTAARLAPPGGALAWHMAGEAARLQGNNEQACCAYLHALAIDALSVASAQQLETLSAYSAGTRALAQVTRSLASKQRAHREEATKESV